MDSEARELIKIAKSLMAKLNYEKTISSQEKFHKNVEKDIRALIGKPHKGERYPNAHSFNRMLGLGVHDIKFTYVGDEDDFDAFHKKLDKYIDKTSSFYPHLQFIDFSNHGTLQWKFRIRWTNPNESILRKELIDNLKSILPWAKAKVKNLGFPVKIQEFSNAQRGKEFGLNFDDKYLLAFEIRGGGERVTMRAVNIITNKALRAGPISRPFTSKEMKDLIETFNFAGLEKEKKEQEKKKQEQEKLEKELREKRKNQNLFIKELEDLRFDYYDNGSFKIEDYDSSSQHDESGCDEDHEYGSYEYDDCMDSFYSRSQDKFNDWAKPLLKKVNEAAHKYNVNIEEDTSPEYGTIRIDIID